MPIRPTEEHLGRQIRCINHIINIAAQAFIKGASALLNDPRRGSDSAIPITEGEENALVREWGKRGLIGKLHNLHSFNFDLHRKIHEALEHRFSVLAGKHSFNFDLHRKIHEALEHLLSVLLNFDTAKDNWLTYGPRESFPLAKWQARWNDYWITYGPRKSFPLAKPPQEDPRGLGTSPLSPRWKAFLQLRHCEG
ncbi:hypothetical protein V8F20_010735 [Naviculisporaceae sp. PSN 640]